MDRFQLTMKDVIINYPYEERMMIMDERRLHVQEQQLQIQREELEMRRLEAIIKKNDITLWRRLSLKETMFVNKVKLSMYMYIKTCWYILCCSRVNR